MSSRDEHAVDLICRLGHRLGPQTARGCRRTFFMTVVGSMSALLVVLDLEHPATFR